MCALLHHSCYIILPRHLHWRTPTPRQWPQGHLSWHRREEKRTQSSHLRNPSGRLTLMGQHKHMLSSSSVFSLHKWPAFRKAAVQFKRKLLWIGNGLTPDPTTTTIPILQWFPGRVHFPVLGQRPTTCPSSQGSAQVMLDAFANGGATGTLRQLEMVSEYEVKGSINHSTAIIYINKLTGTNIWKNTFRFKYRANNTQSQTSSSLKKEIILLCCLFSIVFQSAFHLSHSCSLKCSLSWTSFDLHSSWLLPTWLQWIG